MACREQGERRGLSPKFEILNRSKASFIHRRRASAASTITHPFSRLSNGTPFCEMAIAFQPWLLQPKRRLRCSTPAGFVSSLSGIVDHLLWVRPSSGYSTTPFFFFSSDAEGVHLTLTLYDLREGELYPRADKFICGAALCPHSISAHYRNLLATTRSAIPSVATTN